MTNNYEEDKVEPLVTELGICPVCTKTVYSNRLYVIDEYIYHFTCYNELKQDDKVGD